MIRVAQIAPAVRVSLSNLFGGKEGDDFTNRLVGLLKALGFDYVVETPFGADIVTYLEANEFIERLSYGKPLFTSCCVGWREFLFKRFPDMVKYLSNVVSPMMAMGIFSKFYLSNKWNVEPSNVHVVGIMPCTFKHFETKYLVNGIRYVDNVITTKDLLKLDISSYDIKPEPPITLSSGSGLIFGTTGGVTQALINTLHKITSIKIIDSLETNSFREYTIEFRNKDLHLAVVYGLPMIMKILNAIKQGKHYDFVEFMFCPMGCIGGTGQPAKLDVIKQRAEGLKRIYKNTNKQTVYDLGDDVLDWIKQHKDLFYIDWKC